MGTRRCRLSLAIRVLAVIFALLPGQSFAANQTVTGNLLPTLSEIGRLPLALNAAKASVSAEGEGLHIDTTQTDGTTWRAKITVPIRLQPGQEYVFHIRARASVPSNIPLVLVVDQPTFTPAGILGDRKFGEEPKTLDLGFKGLPAIGNKPCRFEIWTGGQVGTLWIEELWITPADIQAMPTIRTVPDLDQKIQQVLPPAEDMRYLQINWHVNLASAIAEANRTGKPLYLWLMNGHPIGCT